MKSKRVSLFLFLLMVLLLAIVGLSTYLIYHHRLLTLHLNIECSEYMADGFDASGEWVPMGSGSSITLNGKLDYQASTASALEKVVAKITVYDVVHNLQLPNEISIQLNAKGTSVFTKELDFKEWEEPPYCADYKYTVAFYSPEGNLIPHEGDLENSIKNPKSFLFSTPVH